MPERSGRLERGRPVLDEGETPSLPGVLSVLEEGERPSLPRGRPALDVALRLLARREHSQRELRTKLSSRGYEAGEIARTLDRLAGRGLVSDERFAEVFLRSRLERGQGPLKIRAQLRERGVDAPLIDAALKKAAMDWDRCAATARSRRFGEAPPGDREEMARQARFLRGRGFSEGQVARAVLREDAR